MERCDGSSANSLPEREADGSTLWHGFMKDQTADHDAAIELREAKLRLEEAQALARIGNWSYDISTSISHWSKQLFRIFGFDRMEIEPTYQEMLDRFSSEDAAKLDEAVKTATRDGTPYSLVVRPATSAIRGSICSMRGTISTGFGRKGYCTLWNVCGCDR